MKETPISDAAAMRLLINPVRYSIWRVTSKLGPVTVEAIGRHICRDPGAIYRHIQNLEKAELIHRYDTVQTAGRTAVRYVTDENPYLAYDPNNPAVIEAMARIGEIATRQATSECAKSVKSGNAVMRGLKRDTMIKTDSAWVDAPHLAAINKKIDELRALLHTDELPHKGKLVHFVTIMWPQNSEVG
ncbi:MAG: helix-turn-helix domain-containing protein [Pseudomonadota bacterium]